jgi:hypothetical protein
MARGMQFRPGMFNVTGPNKSSLGLGSLKNQKGYWSNAFPFRDANSMFPFNDFTPADIPNFTNGFWLDQRLESASQYVEPNGLTPVAVSGQSVGLLMDRRLFPGTLQTIGSELDTANWTKGVGWVPTGPNSMICDGTQVGASDCSTAVIPTLTAGLYIWEFTVTARTGNFVYYPNSTGAVSITALGNYRGMGRLGTPAIFRASIAGATISIENLRITRVLGNHHYQAIAGSKPIWDEIGDIESNFFDQIDDGYSTPVFAAGNLTAAMDLTVALNRLSAADMILFSMTPADVSNFGGKMISGSVDPCIAGAGASWEVFVDGVQVGGTGTTTAGELHTAVGDSVYRVIEFRNLDLSAWTQFSFGLYTGLMLGGDIAQAILCPAQTDAVRTNIRNWIGSTIL